MVVQPGDVIMAVVVLGAGTTVLYPIARALARRIESGTSSALSRGAASPESDERLRRIEQVVEAMAVEVERVSEGQRFVTKLLAERNPTIPAAATDSQTGVTR